VSGVIHRNLPNKTKAEALLEEFLDLVEMLDIAVKTNAPASVIEQLRERMKTIKNELINLKYNEER
jgi:hypothetical protein